MPKKRTKSFTASLPHIDSFELLRLHLTAPANSYFEWKNIRLTITDNRLYVKSLDASFNLSRLYIVINPVPCHYGGVRHMFVCPLCRKNTRKLYLWGIEFGCRRCFNLAYRSQNETLVDRLSRKKNKISKRLGRDKYEFAPKPKGMHSSTYKSLSHLESTLDDLSLMAFLTKARTLRSIPNPCDVHPVQCLRPKWSDGTKRLALSLLSHLSQRETKS